MGLRKNGHPDYRVDVLHSFALRLAVQIASSHRTFHTRIVGDLPALDGWAEFFAGAERLVNLRLSRGESVQEIARTGYAALGLNAKQFEHALISVRGKRDSAAELAKLHVSEIQTKLKGKARAIKQRKSELKSATKAIAIATKFIALQDRKARAATDEQNRAAILALRLKTVHELENAREKRKAARASLHQHKRRMEILESQLGKARKAVENPSICFGTKKLFKAQFHLEAIRYGSHEHWLKDWNAARAGNVLVVGDSIQSAGNAFAKLRDEEGGAFSIELRLPPGLKHLVERTVRLGGNDIHVLTIKDLRFAHGDDIIRRALANKQPLTWRFVKDDVSWTAHVTVEDRREVEFHEFGKGCVAVDVNVDHLAVTHVSPDGNPLRTWNVPCMTYGVRANRSANIVKHAVLRVVALAKGMGIPIACEKLDFSAKKAALEEEKSTKRARMLSSFAYGAILGGLKTCAIRHGVVVKAVNPAYTSLIGRMKFARRYGLSVHAAAALAVGRRAMDLSERPPSVDYVDEGLHGTLRRPEDRRRHVWGTWRRIARGVKTAALAARGRAGRKAGSVGVEGKAKAGPRSRSTGASPSSVKGCDPPCVKTRPTAWPEPVVGPAVDRNGGSRLHTAFPTSAPTPAVRPIAKAPQKATRIVGRNIAAPPAFAPKAPSAARKINDVADTVTTS